MNAKIQNVMFKCFLACVLSFLAGCTLTQIPTQDEENSFDDLINSQVCLNPCWRGIEVAVTSFDEAKTILMSHYENVTVEQNFLEWEAHDIDGVREGSIRFENNLVSDILLVLDGNGISVEHAISLFGEPGFVQIDLTYDYSENKCFGSSLLFPDSGILLYTGSSNEPGEIGSHQTISVIRLLIFPEMDNWTTHENVLVEWAGYQDYCQYIQTTLPPP